MKTRQFLVVVGLLTALGIVASAQTDESQAVVAEAAEPAVISVYGKEYTRSDVERLRKHVPAQYRANTQGMTNKAFLESFGFLQALAILAEQDGMLEKEPYKTQLQFTTVNFLASSYLQKFGASIQVTDADRRAFYDANLATFQEVQISAIYINYTPVPEVAESQGVPVILESESRAKAEDLYAQLMAGADFATLAREHSDDDASAENGGDLGFFRAEDPLSDVIKATVFRMDVGQTSEPVKDAGRFYLFRVTDKRARPLADVEAAIDTAITNSRLNKRLAEIRGDVKIYSKDLEWLESRPGRNSPAGF